jgi:hypothetical protein
VAVVARPPLTELMGTLAALRGRRGPARRGTASPRPAARSSCPRQPSRFMTPPPSKPPEIDSPRSPQSTGVLLCVRHVHTTRVHGTPRLAREGRLPPATCLVSERPRDSRALRRLSAVHGSRVRESAGLSSERGQIPRRWMVRTGSPPRHAAGPTARRADYLKGTVTGPGTLENTAMKSRSSRVR